jgi:hypothetical protein
VAVVGGHEADTQVLRDLDELRVGRPLPVDAVVLQLDEVVLGTEDVAVLGGRCERGVSVACQQQLVDLGAQAARQADEAGGVLGEKLLVGPWLVPVPLEVRSRRQPHQVAVPLLVAGQHDQMVVGLDLAAATAAGEHGLVARRSPGALGEPAAGRHVQLAADDGLDPVPPSRTEEVQGPEHVAVIGHRHRRHALLGGRAHEIVDPAGAIEHRVLGVDVQVDERVGHSPPRPITTRRGGALSMHAGRCREPCPFTPRAGEERHPCDTRER